MTQHPDELVKRALEHIGAQLFATDAIDAAPTLSAEDMLRTAILDMGGDPTVFGLAAEVVDLRTALERARYTRQAAVAPWFDADTLEPMLSTASGDVWVLERDTHDAPGFSLGAHIGAVRVTLTPQFTGRGDQELVVAWSSDEVFDGTLHIELTGVDASRARLVECHASLGSARRGSCVFFEDDLGFAPCDLAMARLEVRA